MKLIKLTLDSPNGKNNGHPVFIKLKSIISINGNFEDNKTIISYGKGDFVYVQETPNEVYAIIHNLKNK